MKKSLIILVLVPTILFGQKKGFFNYINVHPHFKLSPTVLFPVDGNITPAAFGTAGLRVNRYIALGLSGGCFKFGDSAKPVIPIGIDVTVTDFNSRKITPVFVGQLFYPSKYDVNTHESRSELVVGYPFPNPYIHHNDYYNTKGKMLVQLGGGIALPLKGSKLLITGSYLQFNTKTSHLYTRYFSGSTTRITTTTKDELSMWAFAVSWML